MTNLVVISFPSEAKALEGSHKLSELESFGDISIYEKAMVKKNSDGNVEVLQADTTEGLRTFSGMAIGTMIGALGGPVGLLVGMLAGTMTGAALEMDYFDFSEDFVSKVSNRLQPGSVAVIAEVNEGNPSILNTALESLGGTIFRSDVDYQYEEFVDEQIDELDAEISDERAMIKAAAAEDKAKIQKRIDRLKEKRRNRIEELKSKYQSNVEGWKASRKETKKARIEKKISKHKARIAELEGKLKEIEEDAAVHSH